MPIAGKQPPIRNLPFALRRQAAWVALFATDIIDKEILHFVFREHARHRLCVEAN